MIFPLTRAVLLVICPCFYATAVLAQDIPGIEICTAEKTMERRTSCLQSNIDFQQKTIAKISSDYQQKLDAAKAQIEMLKATLASLQKTVEDLETGRRHQEESRRTCGEGCNSGEGCCQVTARGADHRD
jgi:endonuclease/exonuclease/phosphatase (EEP) superfamily protein YafD